MSNIEELGYNEPHQYDIEELIAIKEEQEKRNASAQVLNQFTGEVRRFRSMSNPGTYHDSTVITEPSVTDTSEYEPLETTIERCQRSGYLREYMAKIKAYDEESAVDEAPDNFDFEPDVVETPGFDLADAKEREQEIINNLNSKVRNEANEGDTTNEPASEDVSPSEPSA